MNLRKFVPLRRHYLIDFKTQVRIILKIVFVTAIFSIIMIYLSYAWIQNLRPAFDAAAAGPLSRSEAFQSLADILLFRQLTVLILMFFFLVTTTIVWTHRLTGPIWKLKRDLKQFLKGDSIEDIKFRKNDEFQDLPPLINRLIHGYKK